MAVKKTNNEIRCTDCGDIKNSKEFYKSYSKLYRGNIENRLTVCKDCMLNLYAERLERVGDKRLALYYVCSKFDMYYSDSLYESICIQSKEKGGQPMKLYSTKINSLPQYRGKTFDDSDNIDGGSREIVVDVDEELSQSGATRKEMLISKWGKNSTYILDDYEWLENFYNEYKETYETALPTQRNLYKNIAKIHLQAEKELADANIKNYNDLMKLSSQLHTDGNIKPVQKNGMADDSGLSTYGLWVKHIENDEPCEYFEDKPLYEDYDKFREYFDKWILRPLKNIFDVGDD